MTKATKLAPVVIENVPVAVGLVKATPFVVSMSPEVFDAPAVVQLFEVL